MQAAWPITIQPCSQVDQQTVLWLAELPGACQRGNQMVATLLIAEIDIYVYINVICPPKIKIVTWSLSIRSWHHRHVRRQENIPCVIFISSKVHNAQVTFSTSNRCCRSLLTQSYKSKVCSSYEIINWHQNYSLDFYILIWGFLHVQTTL